jgi:hypothetical protein
MTYSEGDYSLLDKDLCDLYLQPGFVEGVIADQKRFATLEQAYRHIFRRNLEYAILLWNGIPVKFSYPEDLSAMTSQLIAMLDYVQHPETASQQNYEFRTPNLHTLWQVQCDPETVTIEGFWYEIPGHYEAALNHVGLIHMPRYPFLYEWKLLLKQLIQAIADAEAILTKPKARQQLETLKRIEANIPHWGRFYQYKDSEQGKD